MMEGSVVGVLWFLMVVVVTRIKTTNSIETNFTTFVF